MPFRKLLRRFKDDFKHRLGLNSRNASTTSLPDMHMTQPSPSPVPQASSRAAIPLSHVPFSSGYAQSLTDIPSTATATPLSRRIVTSVLPSPDVNVLSNLWHPWLPGSATPTSAPPNVYIQKNKGMSLRWRRKTAWAGLQRLMMILESSADAFGPLKLAIDGLSQCVDVFEGASQGRKDYDSLRIKLDSLLGELGRSLDCMKSPTMTASMKNLAIEINKELKWVQHKRERDVVQRIAEALEDGDEILESYHRIQAYLERLTLNANISILEMVDEQATEGRLHHLFPMLSAVYNSAESEDVQRGPCTAGTREKELNRLLAWVHDRDAGDIYWMNGMAGTGKTTIAYSLCSKLDEDAKLGASFFCSRLIPECRNVKLILPAISYQLARFSCPFRRALTRILQADPDAHTRVLKTQFETLIVKPLLEVKDALPPGFVVVIDALDECENENSIGQILDILLAQTSSSDLPVRFLLSSRPEPAIYPRMMSRVGPSFRARLVLHDLDVTTVKHDIETYLRAELEDIDLSPLQLAALVERSGVLFIYASTAARYIKAGLRFMEHGERLNMILGLSPGVASSKDRDIDILYTSILKAAFQNKDLEESSRERMKTILDTVICAQEPITIECLAGLLGLTNGQQVDALLRPLCSVLNITDTSGLVTTLHTSFPDFMLDRDRSRFYCDPVTNHGRLARACFKVIEENVPQFNICRLGSSYYRDDELADLTQRVDQAVSPELFYACRYLIAHLELGDPLTDPDPGGLLYDFLSARLLLWIEVLNMKRSMHLGPRIIQRAESWSRAHECSNEMTELAHDAWCFVMMYASHTVSQSTPHLYISMLPFWPESSPIAQHYAKQRQGAIEAKGTAMARRQLALLATWTFDHEVRSGCFSPDGSLVAFGVSSSIYIIDATTGQTVVGPLEHEGAVRAVAFSQDGTHIASGSQDKTIRVWDAQSGNLVIRPLRGHRSRVQSVCFSPDGTRIVSGSDDETIRIWDICSEHTVVGPLRGHTGCVYSVCFSPEGTRIASASLDKTIRVWGAQDGELVLGPLVGHSEMVNAICFSPDGTRIISASADQTIRIWTGRTEQMVDSPLEGHSDLVLSVSSSPDGRHIVSGSRDNTVRLWDVSGVSTCVGILEGHTSFVTSVAFSSDGSRIVSCSHDKTIRVWDARSRVTGSDPLEGHTKVITSVALSPDGKHIVSASFDKSIRVWDAQNGQMVLGPLEGHTDWVASVCLSPDGSCIVSGSQDQTIRVWDVQSKSTVVGPLKGHTDCVRSTCFSPDGTLIATGSWDSTIQVWDKCGRKLVDDPLKGHSGLVVSVCFSPDNTRIISGSYDDTIRIWDVKSRQTVVGPLRGHTSAVCSVCFSPDGIRIASGSADKTVRIWDAQSGQEIFAPLEGHTSAVKSVCFSPDGTLVVSGSDDKTIRLWNAQSGQTVGSPLLGHTGHVYSVVFSPDGMRVISGSSDLAIRVWDIRGLLGTQASEDSLSDKPLVRSLSSHSGGPWVLGEDGWVVDAQSRLLAWVPPDLHTTLLRPSNTLLISTKGFLRLELDFPHLGESWFEQCEPHSILTYGSSHTGAQACARG